MRSVFVSALLCVLLCASYGAPAVARAAGQAWRPSVAAPREAATSEVDNHLQARLSSRFEGKRRQISLYTAGEAEGLVTLEAGGTEGTTGHDFGLLLSRTFGETRLGVALGGAQSHQVLRLSDGHDDFSRVAEDRSTLAAALGYSASPELHLSAPLVLSVRAYAPAEGFTPPYAAAGDFEAPADDEALAAGLSLRWRQQRVGLVGRTGTAVSADLQYEVARSAYRGPGQPPAHRFLFEGEGAWDVASVLGVEFHLAYGAVATGDPREATRLGGTPGFRGILPESIWCERHAAGGLDAVFPLFGFSGWTLGAGVFGDAGRFNLADERQVSFFSAGASARVVRTRDGASALTAEIGHNAPYSDVFYSVGVELEVE